MILRRSVVLGCGGHLPAGRLTNAELSARLGLPAGWIESRTGIRERRIAAAGETTADLAIAAGQAALAAAGLPASAIDLVIVATATPDDSFPATAAAVQAGLGCATGPAFDLQAVSSGFVYGLGIADSLLRTGAADKALLIGAETLSRLVDWDDRETCVLFGDGAGAVVLAAEDAGGTGAAERGILAWRLHADGRHRDLLHVDGGPGSTGTVGKLRMRGREVYRHAVAKLDAVMAETLAAAGKTMDQVDWLVPHQANRRIIETTAKTAGIPLSKVVIAIDRHGNTSAASVPLALAEAAGDGRLRPGDLVMVEAMGGGLTWGAALIRW